MDKDMAFYNIISYGWDEEETQYIELFIVYKDRTTETKRIRYNRGYDMRTYNRRNSDSIA